jgi:hypothetical protein
MKMLMYVLSTLLCLSLSYTLPASAGTAPRSLYGTIFLCDTVKGANSCLILDNQGETPAECSVSYYGRDGRLIKAVGNITVNPRETATRFVAKDIGLVSGKAQGTVEVSVKSGEVAGKMALLEYLGKSAPCYIPLQGISRTSLLCRCFNEVEVNGDDMADEPGEVKTEITLKNPNPSVAKYKYIVYDSEGKNKLKEGGGSIPGHGLAVFSPRTVLRGDSKEDLKVKGSVSFYVTEGSLVGHACLFSSETVSFEVLKDLANKQVKASEKTGAL